MGAVNRIYEKGENSPAIRLLLACKHIREQPFVGYSVSIGIGVLCFAFHWVTKGRFSGATFLPLYPSVVAAALIGGAPAGFILAAVFGAAQWVFFIPVVHWIAIIAYAIDATICVMLIDFINRSFELLLRLIDDEKKLGRRHHLVSRELHHRIQNLFAVVQAVIRLTIIGNNDLRDRLVDRFQSMATTNQLISDSHENGVSLTKLVEAETHAFRNRILITCPDGVMLGPQLAQNLSLILHELAVNAMKYGALSVPEGRVVLNLDWDHHHILVLRWREADGPLVTKPDETGFGSRLLNNFARRLGSVRLDYSRTGFVYALRIDTDEIWLGTALIMSEAA